MTTYEISRVAGDLGPPVTFTYRNTDLTGWALRMVAVYRNTKKRLAINATPIDLLTGQVMFEFSSGDLVEGVADVEFELTPPAPAGRFTVPACDAIRMTVRKDLG